MLSKPCFSLMVKMLEMVVNACLKSTLNVKLLVTVSLA